MSYLFIILSLLFVTQTTDPEPKTLSISTTGEVELTADEIQFNINVNAEAEKPQAAYELHKEREAALVDLLKKYDVQEKNIRYAPVSINKNVEYPNSKERITRYQTNQHVKLTLSDFDVYEKIQVGLIENGYDNFSGRFTSSNGKAGRDQALKKAIQTARSKAQIIAKEAGFKLGGVVNVNYSFNQPGPVYKSLARESVQSDYGNLTEFEQSVTVEASISMEFEILE